MNVNTLCKLVLCLLVAGNAYAQSPKGADLFPPRAMLRVPKLVVFPPSLVTITRTFTWDPVAGADSYTLYAGTNSGTYIWSTNVLSPPAVFSFRTMDTFTHLYWVARSAKNFITGTDNGPIVYESLDSNEVREPNWPANAVRLSGLSDGVRATIYKTTDLKTWQPYMVNARLPLTNAINRGIKMELFTAAVPLRADELWLWNEAANHFGGDDL